MEKNNKGIVYWMLLNNGPWTMYIAATTEGFCYVGSQNAPFEELATWVKKRLPTYVLSEDEYVLKPYATELIDYLEGRRKEFTLPMDLHGTTFQQSVWKVLQEIPYGQTVSYTDIAKQIQKPNAVRAVGTAIGTNPLLITVPCHRVIAKSGKLTGYRGGIEMKEQLLGLEKRKNYANHEKRDFCDFPCHVIF
ncbi:methylated-DNA--[protein]-cysteine S-methyltransferase [Virgibacillus necropolis]|uniref:methylated-DNA--[protein]-cysteine S-methyltransferase n=1 Tax=Virgibacillus necropolis TaxID=163877 RepID=A0A221MCP7_9BACI|nr:methylated-DNA--[protein]-cysteine S-methyltransferase [Virgibacillus necropolis]ASN05411.1 cysteine methyltransferase [Virgibacillus necropolis]